MSSALRSFALLALTFLLLNSKAQAAGYEPTEIPFPWAVEIPMPWDELNGLWMIRDSQDAPLYLSLQVTPELQGRQRVIDIIGLESQTLRRIASGSGKVKQEQTSLWTTVSWRGENMGLEIRSYTDSRCGKLLHPPACSQEPKFVARLSTRTIVVVESMLIKLSEFPIVDSQRIKGKKSLGR